MKGLKNYWMIAVMAILGTWCLTSCSNDDESSGGNDFIEVTIDGKTYRENMFGIYSLVPVTDNLVVSYSTESVFDNKGFGFFYGILMPESENGILNSSTGTYRAVYDFRDRDDVRNFDLTVDLEFYDKDEFYYVESGKHKVTSIRKVDSGIQIEGTFDVIMGENFSDKEKHVTGKYRMTTEAYYSNE